MMDAYVSAHAQPQIFLLDSIMVLRTCKVAADTDLTGTVGPVLPARQHLQLLYSQDTLHSANTVQISLPDLVYSCPRQ